MKPPATVCREGLVILAIILPWLNPFAPGPTPAVLPWLIAVGATAGLIFLESLRAVSAGQLARTSFADDWAFPLALACTLAGVVSGVMGLLQYFGVSVMLEPWVNQTSAGEAFANLRQRNQFASLTNIALASLLFLTMTGRFSGRGHWIALTAAMLLAAGNAASSSRTGLVQIILICGLSWFWSKGRQPLAHRVWVTALLSYALLTLLLPWLGGLDPSVHGMAVRLRDGEQVCGSRLTLWSNVMTLIAQKPWLGWGWGELDYAHYMTLYPGERFCHILDNAHNLPLHLAVELGVPVALLVCGMASWLVIRARPWRETDPARQLAWGVLALIMLHSLLEYPLWYGPFQMAAGLSVGLLWVRSTTSGKVKEKALPLASRPERVNGFKSKRLFVACFQSLPAIIIIAIVAAAVDYYRVSQIYLPPAARDPAYRDDTLNKIRGTWLFGNQLRFAELSTTPLTSSNAAQMHALSSELLHYSPEPRVIEKVIESKLLLGHAGEAALHRARYRAAFPDDHEKWRQTQDTKAK